MIKTTKHLKQIVCLECKHALAASEMMVASCPKCGSAWLDAQYDYDTVVTDWCATVAKRNHNLWRYAELLPIEPSFPEVTMGEGFTPLIRLYQYEKIQPV